MSAVVEVRQLLVRYGGNPKPTLEEISFSVPRGSVYALLGRNGAGKSSLVRCLLGQQKPASGGCFLFGEDVWKCRARDGVEAERRVVEDEEVGRRGQGERQGDETLLTRREAADRRRFG
ncbi:MAG: ATP-binding cassette domain-containing protein, partial [Thermoanaerobaculia bacterium]